MWLVTRLIKFFFTSNDVTGQMDEMTMEADTDEWRLSSGEPVDQREEPLGSLNGNPETDDKENNNGINTDEIQAVRYDFRKYNETYTHMLKLYALIDKSNRIW